MPEGWPIFAEWAARKALPHYGGNKIPKSYLDKFNEAYYAKHKPGQPRPDFIEAPAVSAKVADFVRLL